MLRKQIKFVIHSFEYKLIEICHLKGLLCLLWYVYFGQVICSALRDLVPSVQFKKREKQPLRSVSFSKVDTPPWLFFTFLKLYKWYQIAQRTTYLLISNVTNRLDMTESKTFRKLRASQGNNSIV